MHVSLSTKGWVLVYGCTLPACSGVLAQLSVSACRSGKMLIGLPTDLSAEGPWQGLRHRCPNLNVPHPAGKPLVGDVEISSLEVKRILGPDVFEDYKDYVYHRFVGSPAWNTAAVHVGALVYFSRSLGIRTSVGVLPSIRAVTCKREQKQTVYTLCYSYKQSSTSWAGATAKLPRSLV